MIIWRGWGIIGFLLIGLGIAAVMGLTGQNGTDSPAGTVSLGAGLLLGGTACAVFGYWLNVARPRQQAGGYVEDLRQDLWRRVREGSFQVEPGAAAPRDEAEATQQVEQIVARQRPTIERRLRNRNSLFFIPLQWLGGAVALGGVVLGGLADEAAHCGFGAHEVARGVVGALETEPPAPVGRHGCGIDVQQVRGQAHTLGARHVDHGGGAHGSREVQV